MSTIQSELPQFPIRDEVDALPVRPLVTRRASSAKARPERPAVPDMTQLEDSETAEQHLG
jgi:hypothetical protein